MFDVDDVRVFIKGLTLGVNSLNFDEQFITFPALFSDLGIVRVSSTESIALERPSGKLKDFIKTLADKYHVEQGKTSKLAEPPTKIRKAGRELKMMTEDSDDEIDLDCEIVRKAIDHLNNFFKKDNLMKLEKVLDNSRDEAELEIGLGIHLISKLAGKASTNTSKSKCPCPCGCGEFLQGNEKMWIGSKDTWYGELDIIAGSPATGDVVAVKIGEVETNTEEDSSSEEETDELEGNPGDRTNVEVKFSGYNLSVNQLVTQAVVVAFTEYNRHREKGKCIPSVLIDRVSFRFVIYNPVDDQLVGSNSITFRKKEFVPRGIFRPIMVLWLILNHRIFFVRSPERLQLYLKSRFQEKMSNLQSFQNLHDYSENILPQSKFRFDDKDDSLNVIDLKTYDWFMKKL